VSQPEESTPAKRSPMRIVMIVVAAVVAVVALGYGAIFFYANVINDSPDELDESDLADALAETTTVGDGEPAATDPATTDPARTEPTSTEPAAADTGTGTGTGTDTIVTDTTVAGTAASPDDAPTAGFDGDWVPTDASEFGYRVEEVLAGVNATAVGRSNEISGLMTIAGTTIPVVDIEVQVASITSDESRRDGAFTGRVMNAAEFPTATFTLTQPIELGAVPADGEQITASATGDLTLRGVTNEVTFDVTAQANGQLIGVLGSIPVLFSDYGIDNPSFAGVTTEDNGLVEFVLVFEPA
jgi:polyisoprenoid-binding protein YceI